MIGQQEKLWLRESCFFARCKEARVTVKSNATMKTVKEALAASRSASSEDLSSRFASDMTGFDQASWKAGASADLPYRAACW